MESKKSNIKRFGLIGRNIAYSFSRGYFKQKFETENLEKCTYENFDLNEIQELNKILTEKNIYGLTWKCYIFFFPKSILSKALL